MQVVNLLECIKYKYMASTADLDILKLIDFLPANRTPLGLTFPSLILISELSSSVSKILKSDTVLLTPSQTIVATLRLEVIRNLLR